MTEKVVTIPHWIRLKIKREYFLYLLVLLIPFQQRMYKFFKNVSASLVNPDWHLPVYFEIHLDAFISDFVLLSLIFWCLKKGMEWRSFWEGENKFLSLFLLFALASIVNSSFALYPIHYWRWMHLVLPAFLCFFLRRTYLEEGSFKKIAQIAVVISLIECAIALPQYFVQHSLGLKGLGEATLIATNYVGSNFPMADGSVWIFDKIFHVIRERNFVLRASGTLTHPNILGGFMVFGLLMTYYIYGVSKKRFALSFAILLQIFCLFITYSRAAIFSAALMTIFWIVLTAWREKKLSSLIWVSAGSALLCFCLLYPQIFQRGGIISYNVVAQNSDGLRMVVKNVGLEMFKAHPFLGVGFNNYMLAFATYGPGLPATYIHNVFLHLGVEVGLFGVLSFVVFCGMVFIKGWKNRHKPEAVVCLCVFVALLMIGLVDFYPLCQQEIRLIFFLMAGLLVSYPTAYIRR
jgi:O-antigen ligase